MADRTPLSSRKENTVPIGSRLTELSEARSELLTRVQGLKQDVQSWRSKLDTQVKVYGEELSELKKSLNVEVDQLKSDFQSLRTTLQQQQEDVTARLRSLGLVDVSVDAVDTTRREAQDNTEVQVLHAKENDKETPADDSEKKVEEA